MQGFEIFRTGRHTAMSGEALAFSADDLSAARKARLLSLAVTRRLKAG